MHIVYDRTDDSVFELWARTVDNAGMNIKNRGAAGLHLPHAIRDRIRNLAGVADHGDVHFHQGPQGQPAPCFDARCPNPRLSV